jgi:hypothetical protein
MVQCTYGEAFMVGWSGVPILLGTSLILFHPMPVLIALTIGLVVWCV